MNTYRIQYIRPYISNDSIHSEVILAQDEQQARDIFADCEVLSVELDKQDFDAEMESQKNAARVWTCNMHVTAKEMDAVHNLIRKAEDADAFQAQRARLQEQLKADELAALAYGDADLGTHFTISGGEVMELDGYLESRYDEQNGGDDLPF